MIEFVERPDGLEVLADGSDGHAFAGSHLLDWFWLRDHGEDETSLDAATGQRLVDTFALSTDIQPRALRSHRGSVEIEWEDGATTSHSVSQLSAVLANAHPPIGAGTPVRFPDDVELWDVEPSVEDGSFEALLDSDAALGRWLDGLHRYGFAFATGVPAGPEAIEAISSRIGYVRQTIFGGVWELANDVTKHADSAYATTALEPHTDSTYSVDAPGVQLFCFQERSDEGGESTIVDGFAAAAALPIEHQRTLSSVTVPGRYLEPGVMLEAERPLLRLNSRGELVQVSFNNYDRAPFVIESDQRRFYSAYRAFHEIVNDERRWLSRRLEPGELMAIDNWRALHGRRSFAGTRRALGAYLNQEDVQSRRRVLRSEHNYAAQ